ncbi:GNAT family N-acetyltransferase [Caenimonas sp. SL110]|uniref:GNAT family N-acetyltransferase n=1 Tax=Caenimonas sp. SL110 TaxID=1450524 RepID=UPI001EE6EA31|nr:GNAT family N-acetyltransferase [Caenimonas sp. SL110]
MRIAPVPDVASIERATVAAVAPPRVEELGGWLLPFDEGTVGRARSAVPLDHGEPDTHLIPEIEGRYGALELPAIFRVPDVETFAPFRSELVARGYAESKPTLVQVGSSSEAARMVSPCLSQVEIRTAADDEWASVFLGEGFDPVDGASRVATLRRAQGSLFARACDADQTVAAGVLALGHGWASIHGMRTALTHRRRGYALRVLTALASTATQRGYEQMVLQVEAGNAVAQRLYARCGLRTAWRYTYWERPSAMAPQKP